MSQMGAASDFVSCIVEQGRKCIRRVARLVVDKSHLSARTITQTPALTRAFRRLFWNLSMPRTSTYSPGVALTTSSAPRPSNLPLCSVCLHCAEPSPRLRSCFLLLTDILLNRSSSPAKCARTVSQSTRISWSNGAMAQLD